jgi:hypothetical protein
MENHDRDAARARGAPELTPAERKLLEVVRALDYGEIEIVVRDGKPVQIKEVRKSIKIE